ncbi:MAG: hypothetical protein ABIS27_12755 [Longimicrobiales bacterium]
MATAISCLLAATANHARAQVSAPPSGATMAGMGQDTGSMSTSMMPGALGIPMERLGSGTSWLPDVTPMHAYHLMSGSWELMLHGVAYGMYDRQYGTRGSSQFSSVNWGMLMASRRAAGGRLQLRSMLSAEPYTVGSEGYPLLLQTGETFQDQPLHDRQHPHDLVMELAGMYERSISRNLGVSLYVAPVGEPASGPVAFPHRASAMSDPLAPIGHHWQDATHISFGVLTAGIFTRSVKVEASLFNGREPDENRTNFDYKGRSLDSYATRVSWNPTANWSASSSYAFLKSPEGNKPEESMKRFTASVLHGRRFGAEGAWSTTFVLGANRHSGSDTWSSSYLVETNLHLDGPNAVFGRAEYSRKSAEDLVLGINAPASEFNVAEVTGGYLYDFDRNGTIRTGLGLRASINFVPQSLERYYGSRTPGGLAIFLRFSPQMSGGHGAHEMQRMKGMDPTAPAMPMAPAHSMPMDTGHAMPKHDMGAMPGMSAMPGMGAMKDSSAKKTISPANDSMAAMPGMKHNDAKPVPARPDSMRMADMPGMTMPAAKPGVKAAARKPAAKTPVVKKPGANTPVAKKPVTKKVVPAKPVAKKPVAKKPMSMPGMGGMKMPPDTGHSSFLEEHT